MKEADVQNLLTHWFADRGYSISENVKMPGGNSIDLVAISDKDSWFVEIKGDYDKNLSQYTTNFDTGIGQLIKSITTVKHGVNFALCIPISRTDQLMKLSYRTILPKYAKSIAFEQLNIHLLLVRNDNTVEVIQPNEVRKYLSKWNS